MSIAATSHAGLIAAAAQLFRATREWRIHLPAVFASLGEGLGVSRVYLFQVHELSTGGLGQTCLFDWAAPGLNILSADSRNIGERLVETDDTVMRWAEARRKGELIEGRTRDLTGYLRQDFEHQQIKSFVSYPIWVNGHWWGHLGFDDCAKEREWSESEKSVLRAICYLLGDTIELSTSSLIMSEATRVAMLRSAPDGIIVVDEVGAILEFNPAAEKIFGRRRTQVLGRPISSALVPPEQRRAFDKMMRLLIHGRSKNILGKRVETGGLHASGKVLPIELAVTEIRQGGRRLFVSYMRDLTETKNTAAEVIRQREALHQSEKMTALGSLLAGVAHELNNPLSVVIGRAIMLEEDAKDPTQRERIRKLREAAERCAKVSKTFLAMARQSPAVRAPMSLNKAIQSALDLVAYALRSGGISVRLSLDDALPDVTADFDQMVQVFVNLFVNAEHAMREVEGTRTLTIASFAGGDGRRAIVEVKDSGIGIKPEIMPRIFEPFFTTKAVGVGTGMGLAVSFGMIAAHGGSLEAVPSSNGRGATFRLSLPVGGSQPIILQQPIVPSAPLQPKRRILVVDDEPEVVSLLSEIFERAGHDVEQAEDGAKALALAGNANYDAIFCDLRMPVMDGRTLRRKLGQSQPRYQSRMAFITGDLLGTVKQEGGLDGCPVIEKPFHAETVLNVLSKLTAP